jgi:hypothetical protein
MTDVPRRRRCVAQVAKPALSQESAAFSGRFGNLRYVGRVTSEYNIKEQ